ncbi:MAG: DNA polymerase ligase N-terminal domain-containing protein [Methanomassiliicoccales archaeon]
MPLDEYREKRDFRETPEPSEGGEEERIFVIQEHHASHFHHDFRLAMGGVLRSWAVPKGVPTEPKVKRLAVQTEDHPLAYAGFEGEIPEGQYGAGKVIIWDRGTYELEEEEEGKLVFRLNGERLEGRYALIRFKGRESEEKNWLLMRTG